MGILVKFIRFIELKNYNLQLNYNEKLQWNKVSKWNNYLKNKKKLISEIVIKLDSG